MAQLVDSSTVHDAAVDLEATKTPVTVPHLADALKRKGIDFADAELRASVADLETRRYLGFAGQWDAGEKVYTVI